MKKIIDEITLYAKAGDGGDGVVRWASTYGKPKAGPAGGNGGRGGDVYLRGVKDILLLKRYARGNKKFIAEDGEPGKANSAHGKNGEDIIIDLPLGSIIKIFSTGKTLELLDENKEVLILKGGMGGFGNEHFKSSVNVVPKESTKGKKGESSELYVELRLIADIGIIGMPNAGKSSLLNALTNSVARVGNYPFTTITPNLGSIDGIILADIPGLIEDASKGKGLGDQFLRHILRTKSLIHCISVEQDDPISAYRMIKNEMYTYNIDLSNKPEILLLTKIDLISTEKIHNIQKQFKKQLKKVVLPVSINMPETIAKLKQIITH